MPFSARRIFVHHCFAPQLPTLAAVHQSLDTIWREAEAQDTILFYFSGHGVLTDVHQQPVLCLRDTFLDDLLGTGLLLQKVLRAMNACPAHQQILWLDTCHSGGLSREVEPEAPLPNPMAQLVEALGQQAARRNGFYALLSCEQDQRSWEFPELGHGLFTNFLVHGLRGAAADGQGRIEADGLYKYVYHQTLRYLDNLNRQIRLANQGKRQRGEETLYAEYPLQTPKRIVEGVGEIILSSCHAKQSISGWQRRALVVEGLESCETSLSISKTLAQAGAFSLTYWPRGEPIWSSLRDVIEDCLRPSSRESQESFCQATVLLYLRGRLEETVHGESCLVVREEQLSPWWLRHALQQARVSQYIVVLDFPGASALELDHWIDALQLGPEVGACILAAAAPAAVPEQFTQVLSETLQQVEVGMDLSVAVWISRLQEALANLNFPLHCWLSATRGVIDILPGQQQGLFTDLGVGPYRGLRAFTVKDAPFFYGRETLTQEILKRLSEHPFVAVVGDSGSGKSSIVQAGVMACLRQGKYLPGSEGWWVGLLRPGAQPLSALAHVLDIQTTDVESFVRGLRSRQEPWVVLVVDQFEELFTLVAAQERAHFLDLVLGALTHAADRFKLVITLRSDFITGVLAVPNLASFIQKSSVLVPAGLTAEDYRQVVLAPAQKVGLQVAPELVEALLDELTGAPGDLALLEFVLERLWECREGGSLSLRRYEEDIGGLRGALERKAQLLYESLDEQSQSCARWLLLALIHLGEGVADTRRQVNRSALKVKRYPEALVNTLLERFKEERLVVLGTAWDEFSGHRRGILVGDGLEQTTVEIAHEILIREWSTLRLWLEQSRAQLRLQRQIEQAAVLWQKQNRLPDFLLRGVRLAEAEELYLQSKDELPESLQSFISAGLREREGELQAQRWRLRQAQIAAGVMGVLAIVALGFGGATYWQFLQSQEQQIETLVASAQLRLASDQQLEALSDSIQAEGLVQQTWTIPMAIQAKVASTLQEAVYSIQEMNRLTGHTNYIQGVCFRHDGQQLASGSWDNTIRLWGRDGTLVRVLKGHTQGVVKLQYSPDDQVLASASFDGSVRLWNPAGKVIQVLRGHRGTVWSLAFSPDGKTLVTGGEDGTVRLWDWRIGQEVRQLRAHQGPVQAVQFNPRGKTMISAGDDQVVRLWRLDGQLLQTFKGHSEAVYSVDFSPNGQMIVSGSLDKTIQLWRVGQGWLRTLRGHTAQVYAVRFNLDGKSLVSGSSDHTVRLWFLDGTPKAVFKGHRQEVWDVALSPDGKIIASAGSDRTVRLWQVTPNFLSVRPLYDDRVTSIIFHPQDHTLYTTGLNGPLHHWNTRGEIIEAWPIHDLALALNPQGTVLASAGNEPGIRLWDANRKLLEYFPQPSPISKLDFSSDGQMVVALNPFSGAWLWQRGGKLLGKISVPGGQWKVVRFSPDGKVLATAGYDKVIRLWDVKTRKLLKTFTGHSDVIENVIFSSDGAQLISASKDRTIRIWKRSGTLEQVLTGHTDWVLGVSLSKDGQRIASASQDGTIRLWNWKGQLLNILHGHRAGVRMVRFTPDQQGLISGDEVGTLLFWRSPAPDTQNLMQQGCAWIRDYRKSTPSPAITLCGLAR